MAETTGIAWCDHTFNPWVGCQAVSPACAKCYAKALVERWGKDFSKRSRTTPVNWKMPLRWNRIAASMGIRRRVFCASLADVFDNQVPDEWRSDLWPLIRACPALDWLLLTKRPQNIVRMLPPDWGHGYPNVWLGTTTEDQVEADRRIPHLLAVPAVVRFLSCEPLLGGLDLRQFLTSKADGGPTGLHWIIIGGESGHHSRPMNLSWVGSLLNQCGASGVPVFFKQLGNDLSRSLGCGITGKGDKLEQWPEYLRVQDFPR